MSEDCQYSIRLVNRLKDLDQGNQIDFDQVGKAIDWAKKYHGDQKRKSGEPYYTHPLEVAYMVSEYLLKTDVIVAAILHDIVEDTEVTFGMILDNFSKRIMQLVDRLTRDRPDGTKWSVEEILDNAYENNDNEALLIKVVDRLHNMQTIGAKSPEKIVKTTHQTIDLFILISMYLQNTNLESRILQSCYKMLPKEITESKVIKQLNSTLVSTPTKRRDTYQLFSRVLKNKALQVYRVLKQE